MELNIKWHKPIKLHNGSKENLIYRINDLSILSDIAGIYMFCRKYGKSLTPLYIGKAENIAMRIKQQLNSTKLMKGIENALNGEKVLLVGEFISKSGQNAKTSIAIIEKALIEHSLSMNYEILNVQGTKTQTHSIMFSGYSSAKALTGQSINVKKRS
jgi:hypothetical protein